MFKRLALVSMLAALGTSVVVVAPSEASAGGGSVFTVMNTSEQPPDGIWFRNSPHTADTSRTTGLGVYMNEQVQLQCYAFGDVVGRYNDSLWYFVRNVTRPANNGAANQGYLNAHYINDGKNANQVDAGVPACGATQAPPPPPNAFYNRMAAANWALGHSEDAQAYGAMCTWFVSQSLWAGGFPQSSVWTSQGHYTSAPGTKTAWVVPDFLSYIRANYSTTWVPLGLMTPDHNNVPMAEPGDIIAYDWGDGHGISHLALVVDDASGSQYPEVAEMGQYDWGLLDFAANKLGIHKHSSYQKRGWTWSAVHNEWLEAEFHNRATAYLLHINGGYIVGSY